MGKTACRRITRILEVGGKKKRGVVGTGFPPIKMCQPKDYLFFFLANFLEGKKIGGTVS